VSFLIVVLSILFLVVLISYFKVNPFLAFLIVSIICGLALGINPSQIEGTIHKGMGDMLGSLIVVILAGSMLGKLVAETGAAQKIATSLMTIFGQKYLQLALMITGFIIGIPLFYNVGFVLVFPLIASVVYRYKLPALFIGMPMITALSVTHGFLPPHPSPSALVAQLNASMSITLLYGVMIAIPTVLIAGLLFSKTLRNIPATVLKTFQKEGMPEDQLPGLFNSMMTSLLPVLLLGAMSLVDFSIDEGSSIKNITQFLSGSSIVMLISLIIATYTLGISRGLKIPYLMEIYADSIKDVMMIILIIGGAGALKQTLIQSGVDKEIGNLLDGLSIHPLILGWIIAGAIRVCVGSATVAGLTAAGIVAPLLISNPDVNPSLMVLAVGAGSLMFSHVNDSGFWLFKEYFNLSIKDTVMSWSLMETIVAICGLIGVMTINSFV
jgi:Gnt-I system high-affinity gluconate transporter